MHIAGSWILLGFIAVTIGIILLVLHLTRLGRLVHQQIPDLPQQRLFLAAIAFFLTFLAVRLLVAGLAAGLR